jgi:Mce-associated membrane protein
MDPTSNPTWYDVLGVSRDASPDEIKAAWRDATDKFQPGSGAGQFRMFNEAADVLLDPARRAAYDETLDGTSTPPPPPAAPEPTAPEPTAQVDPKAERREERDRRREAKRTAKLAAPAREPASGRSIIVAGVLAVLTVAAIVLAVVFGLQVRTEARVADAREQAPAAAERAAEAIFAYDYRTLPADLKRAKPYLTANFEKQFTKNFELLEKQKDGAPGLAVQTKSVVKSAVAASGVVDAEDGVVRVLVYVNLSSTRPNAQPQIFQNRVTMKMVKEGDKWLVDKVDTY